MTALRLFNSVLALILDVGFVLGVDTDPTSLTNLFRVSTASTDAGNCGALTTELELFVKESKILAEAMQHAVDNYQDDIVARELLTSYFGVNYDYDAGEVADDSLSAWESFRSTANLVTSFLTTGNYDRPSAKRPWLFCDGNFGDHYSWNAVARDSTGNEIELEEDDPEDGDYNPSLLDVYEHYVGTRGTEPCWVQPLTGYVFLPERISGNVCNHKSENGETIAGYTGRGNTAITQIVTGDIVDIPAFPDGIALCPKLLTEEETPWKESLEKVTYIDPENPENEDLTLFDVMPDSTMMLHEIVQLVTAWRVDDENHNSMVIDVDYDLAECLWLALDQYQNSDGEHVDKYMATMNAQTYAYFAMSYWYSLQEWDGKERVTFDAGKPVLAELFG